MFFKGVSSDIYIGSGAGKMLSKDISEARSSLTIVSPYISSSTLENILSCYNKGIKIEFLTSFPVTSFHNNYDQIYSLILQERFVNEANKKAFNNKLSLFKIVIFLKRFLFFSMFPLAYYFRSWNVAYILFVVIVINFIQNFLLNKIKFLKVYSYNYFTPFPFRVNYKGKFKELVHSKIFIIDNKIAYLGSLNYTYNGLNRNHETRVRITDPEFIKELQKEVNLLFNSSKWVKKDLQHWGSELYSEPLNDWK